jgi:hypothetical protein
VKFDISVPIFRSKVVPSEWKSEVVRNFLLHNEAENSTYFRNGGAYLSKLLQLRLSLP